MKNALYLFGMVLIAVLFFVAGHSYKSDTGSATAVSNLEVAAQNHPRGGLNIPAQWFMMESTIGWEKMMLIFGYADNRSVCSDIVDMAYEESPDRNFTCEPAN